MRHPVLTILKKELARFFGDKRMVVSILMPGILVYLLYSLMGTAMTNQFSGGELPSYTVGTVRMPESLRPLANGMPLVFAEVEPEEIPEIQADIGEQTGLIEALAVFPEDFDASVAAYAIESGTPAPAVEIYYNSVASNSSGAYQAMEVLLDSYESMLINKFDVNPGEGYDLANDRDLTASMFASLLPMLLMMFLFSGCMSVAPESIAGEKERGTIATLLVTPVPRSSIALGKILALAMIALLAGTSSTIGTVLALPKLMGGAAELSGNVYGLRDYLALAVVILSTVLVLIALISIVSAYAKSIKEASTMMTPLMILNMVIGITAMFGGAKTEVIWYCIPLYNSVQCMSAIFSFQLQAGCLWVTAAVNVAVAAGGTYILTRMFHSESVIFSR